MSEIAGQREQEEVLDELRVLREEFEWLHDTPTDWTGKTSLGDFYTHVHDLKSPRTALCLSGGGIRSATYCLGALQALAQHRTSPSGTVAGAEGNTGVTEAQSELPASQLERIHYLSTVSGGGYIGAMLTAWHTRRHFEYPLLCAELARSATDQCAGDRDDSPIAWLRRFSNYLAPKRGWSSDTWAMIALFARNLLLNWFVVIPAILAVLALPLLHLSALRNVPPEDGFEVNSYILIVEVFLISLLAAAYLSKKKNATRRGNAAGATGRAYAFSANRIEPWFYWHLEIMAGAVVLMIVVLRVFPVATDFFIDPMNVAVFFVPSVLLLYWFIATFCALSPWPAGVNIRRERLARGSGDVIAIGIAWATLHTIVFFLPSATMRWGGYSLTLISVGGVAGILAAVGGFWEKFSSVRQRARFAQVSNLALHLAAGFFVVFVLGVGGSMLNMAMIAMREAAPVTTSASPADNLRFQQAIEEYRSTLTVVIPKLWTWDAVRENEKLGNSALELRELQEKRDRLQQIEVLIAEQNRSIAEVKEKRTEPPRPAHPEPQSNIQVIANDASVATFSQQRTGAESEALRLHELELQDQIAQLENEKRRLSAKIGLADGITGHGTDLLLQGAKARLRDASSRAIESLCVDNDRLCEANEWLARQTRHYQKTRDSMEFQSPTSVFVYIVSVMLVGSLLLGVNRFSLGNFYLNRLVRAYLGASRIEERKSTLDQYSGFDGNDDLPLSHCIPKREQKARLFPVLGGALNLVSGSRLDWQQRKARNFTMSPLHCGAANLGYQRTSAYAGKRGLSLGTAMAISGAAVSPSMGCHSSPLITFVLAFFNARLGWWLPNPGRSGRQVWGRKEPRPLEGMHVKELLGRTNDEEPYVYLSDGGHFDNLGLYEMVRRRCARILVIDATCDPENKNEDLAATVRKIRVDLGVSIEFDPMSEATRSGSKPYSVATIRYPEVSVEAGKLGYLIYLKPVVGNGAPLDVRRYSSKHASKGDCFPHQSTADQFFDEEQFESYRALGYDNMRRVLSGISTLEDPVVLELQPCPPAAEAPSKAGDRDSDHGGWHDSLGSLGGSLISGTPQAIQSWGTLGMLATAVTIGGVVGIAGTVALAPGGTVSLEPGAQVAVSGGALSLEPGGKVSMEPGSEVAVSGGAVTVSGGEVTLNNTGGKPGNVPITVKTEGDVKASGSVKLEPPPALRLDPTQLRALQDALLELATAIAGSTSTTGTIADDVSGIRTNTENIGPRRQAIEGREGAR